MREQERKLLGTPLPIGTDPDGAERELRRVVGVYAQSHEDLLCRMVSGMSATPSKLGGLSIDEQRRALIGDHAYASTRQVAEHLVYAIYDYWEALDHWERCDAKYRRLLTADGRISSSAPETVGAYLHEDLSKRSANDVFARLASAMDCLAVPIIVGLRLPLNVLKASFNAVADYLTTNDKRSQRRLPRQTQFGAFLTEAIGQVGPPHWRDWCMDYRQMVVHRGQRTSVSLFKPTALILDQNGQPVPRVEQTVLLLRDPDLANVEAFVQFSSQPLTLTEPAQVTLRELVESTRALVDRVCAELLRVENESVVGLGDQPLQKQWPEVRRRPTHTFAGYAPGTVNVAPSQMLVSAVDEQRLRATAPHDAQTWQRHEDPSSEG